MSSPTTSIGDRIFYGCQKAIIDFIITPLYTVSIVGLLIFTKLIFISLCAWDCFAIGYFGVKVFSHLFLQEFEHEEIFTIFGIVGTGTGIVLAIHFLPYTKSYFWFPLSISISTTCFQYFLLYYINAMELFIFIFGGIFPCLLCLFYWTTIEKDCHTLKATVSYAHFLATNPWSELYSFFKE